MKVLFTFTLLFFLLNQGIFASHTVKGFIFQCPDTEQKKVVAIDFTGDEERKDKKFKLTNIVPTQKEKITDELMQTSTVLLDTIIPDSEPGVIAQGSSSSQQLAHPLSSTFQLIHGGKYKQKYVKFGAKQLVYEGRFVAKETMPIIVFGFHKPLVHLILGDQQSQKQNIEKLFDSIRTICKSVICMSYLPLPLSEDQSFDPNVYHLLNFTSHFFYKQTSGDITFPPLWYLIHDSNFAAHPTAENMVIVDTTKIDALVNSVMAATNFVYKLVDRIIEDGRIKPTPIDIKLAQDGKVADFLDMTIPKSISKPVNQYKFCEIESNPNPVLALTNNSEFGQGKVILGKNLNLLKRIAVKLRSGEYEHQEHQEIYQKMKLYFKNHKRENDVVPIPMPGLGHVQFMKQGVPRYKYAMESLGPNLNHDALLGFCREFPILCYREIALQMLERVYLLQEIGFIHRDLRPANFYFGLGHLKQFVYLAEFGTMQNFAAIFKANNIQTTGQTTFGACMFAAMDTHKGLQVSWKDEYESLGYGIISLMCDLPFRCETREKCLDEKMNIHDYFWDRFEGGRHMQEYFAHLKNVKYGNKPDYQFLVGCIKRAILEGKDTGKLPKFKTEITLFGINLREWNQIPIIQYEKVGKPIGLKAAKLCAVTPTLFIDEKLLFRSSQNQEDLYHTDYVATNACENDKYVMILPGIEEMVSLLCSNRKSLLCIMIVDDANGNSLLQTGNYISTLIKSTMSRDEFESKVLENGNTKNPVYQAIDSKAPNTDRITNVAVPSGNFTDALVQQYRTTMLDIANRLKPHQSPTK